MAKRKQVTRSGSNYFYDVIPAVNYLGQMPQPVIGALTLKDIQPGQYVRIVDAEEDWVGRHTVLIVTKPERDRDGEYRLVVVPDNHFRLAHPTREAGDFSQCCYQSLSLRDMGVIPNQYGRWDKRYTLVLEDRSHLL